MDGAERTSSNEQTEPWEQVWQGTSETAAEIVAGRLRADGIPANVRGHSFQQRTVVFSLQGAWAVYVPWSVADLSRDLLRASGEGGNIIESELEAGLTSGQSSTLRAAFIGLLLIAVAGVLVAIRKG
jgi:hypothetical protein